MIKRTVLLVAAFAAGSAFALPPKIAGCQVYPANSIWNVPVDHLPVDPDSATYITTMQGATRNLHPDWGNDPADFYGIPFMVVPGNQPKVTVTFDEPDESDLGPYPIPPDPLIEGGPDSDGDRHILMLDSDNCVLYEISSAYPPEGGGTWTAFSGAIFDLKNNAMRPDTWTSADAAGLAILPGLVRWEEAASGEITHAIRMTAQLTRNTFVWPASHQAGSAGATRPPMGQRFRLRADFNIAGLHPVTQTVLRALKKYGAIIADNGSNWFISGTTSTEWPDLVLSELKTVGGDDFEAVDGTALKVKNDSYAAKAPSVLDFNADRHPDLLWRATSSGNTYLWHMNGPALVDDVFVAGIDPSWTLEGVADFNADGQTDLVWRDTNTGATYAWYMNGASLVSDAFLFSLPPVWKIEAVEDFNQDGRPDFLMRNTATGLAFIWFFDNATPVSDQYLFTIDPSWKVEAVADFDLDGQPDLLFRNVTSGLAFVWNTSHSATAGTSLGTSTPPVFSIDPAWEVVQATDWNGDGKADLVFRSAASGVVFVWYMDGTTLGASDFIIQIDPSWEIVPRR